MPKEVYRILVVDDSDDIRELLNRAFTRLEHKCDVARNGLAAKNLLKLYTYDALVTDLAMPQMHGHQLIQEVLDMHARPMIAVITGVAEPKLVADLISRGIEDFSLKPVSPVVYATKIVALIERRKRLAISGAIAPTGSPQALATQIEGARITLQQQLAQMTKSFQSTIADLEKQQNMLEQGLMGSARLFSSLLGKLGGTGSSHAGRVETIAVRLASELGFKAEEKQHLGLAALLHDIGQFGLPDELKAVPPWSMSPEQRKEYELYPSLGAALLGEVPGMQPVAAIIEAHGENYDGSGFPHNLKGDAIPLASRIVRIADGCDLHYMQRKTEHPIEELRDHLSAASGVLYDPTLAKIVLPMLVDSYRELSGNPVPYAPKALPEGYALAEDVYDQQGHFLARSGAIITPHLRERLSELLQGAEVYARPVANKGGAGTTG